MFGTCQTSGIPTPAQINLQERCFWEYCRWNGQEEGQHPPAPSLMDLQLLQECPDLIQSLLCVTALALSWHCLSQHGEGTGIGMMDESSCRGELGPGGFPSLALQLAKCFTCFDAFHVFGQLAVFILGGRSALPADAGGMLWGRSIPGDSPPFSSTWQSSETSLSVGGTGDILDCKLWL